MDVRSEPESLRRDVYEDLRPLLFSIAYGMVKQREQAEDIVQGAFLRLSPVTEREPAQEETISARKATRKSAKSTTASGKTFKGFTDEERLAMKERAQELKAAARHGPRADKADGESAVLAKIAEMPEPDRAMGKPLHAIIKTRASTTLRTSTKGHVAGRLRAEGADRHRKRQGSARS